MNINYESVRAINCPFCGSKPTLFENSTLACCESAFCIGNQFPMPLKIWNSRVKLNNNAVLVGLENLIEQYNKRFEYIYKKVKEMVEILENYGVENRYDTNGKVSDILDEILEKIKKI